MDFDFENAKVNVEALTKSRDAEVTKHWKAIEQASQTIKSLQTQVNFAPRMKVQPPQEDLKGVAITLLHNLTHGLTSQKDQNQEPSSPDKGKERAQPPNVSSSNSCQQCLAAFDIWTNDLVV